MNELDRLREPLRGRDDTAWQAEIVWGIALRPDHGPGSDDNAVGVWRPKSSREWAVHDPQANLIAVGGGTRLLDDAERLAKQLRSGGNHPPIVSTSVMISSWTLTMPGTRDGIEAIERWAARVGTMPVVRWATIRETAAAWMAAGGVPSRQSGGDRVTADDPAPRDEPQRGRGGRRGRPPRIPRRP